MIITMGLLSYDDDDDNLTPIITMTMANILIVIIFRHHYHRELPLLLVFLRALSHALIFYL